MKKICTSILAVTLFISLFGSAEAGSGCGNCPNQAGVKQDQFRTFQQDTLELRQAMMLKRFDLQRENLKGAPDKSRLTAIEAEIAVIQAKIMEARLKNGMPDCSKLDGECAIAGECITGKAANCNRKPCNSGSTSRTN